MKRNCTTKVVERCRRPWLVCAALAVVFGHGPVPWFHSHELMAHDTQSPDALARHLQHFHPSGDEDDHCWHIHWTLPWHVLNCPCQHDNTPLEERVSVLEMAFDVAQSSPIEKAQADIHASAPPPMLAAHERGDRPPWDPLRVTGLHFLETYLPTVSLRALLCVALC